ncbi:MAG: SPFH domain-containing protein [Bacillota bacterium]|jgi:regulator of protease activity HflC (stomatin/prohibitin superfamily)
MILDDPGSLIGLVLTVFVGLFVLATVISAIRVVRQSTQVVVERLGRYHKVMHSGLNFLVPFIDHVRAIVDMREQVVDFPPQPVITKDNVTMQIDTVVYYQVTDVTKYVYEISNPRSAIENMTATTLRNIIGELDLDETLTSRDIVNSKLRVILDEATDKWGIKVNRVELKNIMPPRDIQDAMEKQMRAERERREAILKAEGEKQAAILTAEGSKRSVILQAEANREKEILKAEAEKQRRILEADGQAEAILRVQQATAEGLKLIKAAGLTPEYYVMLQGIDAMKGLGQSPSSKLVIPTDASKLLGALPAMAEALGKKAESATKVDAPRQD